MAAISPGQRAEWATLADRLSAQYRGYDVTVEVLDPVTGDNRVVERAPFGSLTYDHRDDVVVVSVGGTTPGSPVALRHMVSHPQELVVDLIPQGAAVEVTDAAGATTLVSLLRRRDGEDGQGT
jgi:hypothetical protein